MPDSGSVSTNGFIGYSPSEFDGPGITSPEANQSIEQSNSRGLPFYASGSQEKLAGEERSQSPKKDWSRHFVGWNLILFGSWFNLLVFMIPIAWTTKLIFDDAHPVVFSLCILGLIPLVRLHDLSIAELALRIGGSKTGLLNASMSNFIETVVAISALRKCELRVVQSSLVGSILSKLLLVLGLCFFAGGMRFSEQVFDQTATQVHSSLLIISVGVLLLPAAYHFTLSIDGEGAEFQKRDILHMSHGVSIVMIFIYVSYLAFQLWSHTHLYSDRHNKKSARLPATQHISAQKAAAFFSAKSPSTLKYKKGQYVGPRSASSISPPSGYASTSPLSLASPTVRMVEHDKCPSANQSIPGTPTTLVSSSASGDSIQADETLPDDHPNNQAENRKPPKEPQLSWFLTILLLLSVTMAVAITADWLVESMDGVSTRVSKDWVALILLPLITSVAECITSVKVSVKDELSLSISVAVGSTIQTTLFVIPFMVLLAWAVGKPLTLLMDPFQSLVLCISVQTTSYVISDGKSNWLEGVILISLYVIIAVAFWFYPGSIPLDYLIACPVTS